MLCDTMELVGFIFFGGGGGVGIMPHAFNITNMTANGCIHMVDSTEVDTLNLTTPRQQKTTEPNHLFSVTMPADSQ